MLHRLLGKRFAWKGEGGIGSRGIRDADEEEGRDDFLWAHEDYESTTTENQPIAEPQSTSERKNESEKSLKEVGLS